MVDTCHVTGVVISPDGDPVPRATVRFQRLPHEVFVEDDKTGIPREVRAEADEEGNITVDLIPGEYKAIIIARGYNQYPAFNVGVPDQPSAVLADIQDVPPPPSLDDATRAVRDAREARDESREARDEADDARQAAEAAAQTAQEAADVLPDPEGVASGQLVETNGADGFRLIEPGDLRALRRRDAWMGLVRSRVTIWDDGDAGVSTPTNAIGLQLPSGQTWQGFQSVDGRDPILEYMPGGFLRSSRSVLSGAMDHTSAPFAGVQCGAAFRKIRAQMKAVANTGRRVGLFLSYFDSLNFLYINMSGRGHDLIYVLEGEATQLGTITPVSSGSVLDYNTLDLSATVSSSAILGTSVEFQSHGIGIGRINLPAEAEVFADPQNPGLVGFCGGDVTQVYGFAVMELD